MLKSMVPRSALLLLSDEKLREFVERFFLSQEWNADLSPPYDLVVYDDTVGKRLLKELRQTGDRTPGLYLQRGGSRSARVKYSLALTAPFTAERLRDACGALLRKVIKHVPKRKPSE